MILTITNFVQISSAFYFTYSDDTWEYLMAEGPDFVKAGNVESYTVTGKLLMEDGGPVHFYFWVNTQSQQYERILEDDAFPLMELGGHYPAGYTYSKTYQITIPSDTINNSYLWIKIDSESRHFSPVQISLVQDPSYDDLQQQIDNLNSLLNSTQSQLTSTQSSLDSANTQIDDLQTQLNNTQSQLDNAQSQISNLQSQLNATQSQLGSTQSMVNNLIILSVIVIIAVAFLGLSTIYLIRKAKE